MPPSRAVACRELKLEEVEILLNVEIIALNQDPLGVAGDLVAKEGPQEVCHIHTQKDLPAGMQPPYAGPLHDHGNLECQSGLCV